MKKILFLIILTIFIAGCSNIELPQNLCDNQDQSQLSQTILSQLEPMQGQELNKIAKKLFNNQNINIYLQAKEDNVCKDNYLTFSITLSQGKISSITTKLSLDPTINVKTNQDTITNLLTSENQLVVLKHAIDNNLLEMSAIGFKNKIKLVSALSTIKASVKQEDFENYKEELRNSNVQIEARAIVDDNQDQEELEPQMNPENTILLESCQNPDEGWQEGKTYILSKNIESQGTCFEISNAQNIVFDCQNNKIEGNADGVGVGVGIYGSNQVTLRNCKIENFFEAITLRESNNVELNNNKLKDNARGVFLIRSPGTIFRNNEIKDSSAEGVVVVDQSQSTSFYSNEIKQNDIGLDLSGNFHDLNDNKICNNELDLRLGNTVETINAAQNKLDSIENEGNVELTNEHYRSCEDENQEEQLENTQITQCETFTDNSGTGPFEYTLENDIQLDMDEDGWACLHLVGRITLDCQGHTIRGYQQEGREGYLGTAITLGDRHNLGPYNIINCNIENVGTGIESNKAGSLIIRNTKIENADVRAIDVRETQFTIQESSITNSKKGLYVEFSPVANIFYNNFTNNMENGIFLNGNDATRVSHNNFCNNALEPYLNRPAFDITCVNSDRTFAENNAFSSSDVENCGNMQQAVVACE